jgi:hypothetical protein
MTALPDTIEEDGENESSGYEGRQLALVHFGFLNAAYCPGWQTKHWLNSIVSGFEIFLC